VVSVFRLVIMIMIMIMIVAVAVIITNWKQTKHLFSWIYQETLHTKKLFLARVPSQAKQQINRNYVLDIKRLRNEISLCVRPL
jgi:predicted PurR-regulated permease PerM